MLNVTFNKNTEISKTDFCILLILPPLPRAKNNDNGTFKKILADFHYCNFCQPNKGGRQKDKSTIGWPCRRSLYTMCCSYENQIQLYSFTANAIQKTTELVAFSTITITITVSSPLRLLPSLFPSPQRKHITNRRNDISSRTIF